jgi:hypothetical protein
MLLEYHFEMCSVPWEVIREDLQWLFPHCANLREWFMGNISQIAEKIQDWNAPTQVWEVKELRNFSSLLLRRRFLAFQLQWERSNPPHR